MILLLLLFLSTSVAAASDFDAIKPGAVVVFMPGTYDKEHPPTLAAKDVQCLVKMRESMKQMNSLIGNSVEKKAEHQAIYANWNTVMKECVQ